MQMLQWMSAIVVALAVGSAASWLALGPLRRRDEAAAGIATLAAMSWREFIRIVLDALSQRGYRRLVDRESPAADEYVLLREGQRWLLSAKHGSAFVLGRSSVHELAAAMALSSAAGGLLVTQGRIDDDARQAARGQAIELHDGQTLWPELRPLLPAWTLAPIRDAATRRARERVLVGWLLAVMGAVLVFTVVPASRPASGGAMPMAPVAPAAALETAPVPAGPAALADPDAATLERQRRELAAAVATLPARSARSGRARRRSKWAWPMAPLIRWPRSVRWWNGIPHWRPRGSSSRHRPAAAFPCASASAGVTEPRRHADVITRT